MRGKLYAIGVGPGDPELLTLKALKILRGVPCICVPKGREEGSSLALSIVQKALSLEGKEIIETHFPMRKTKSIKASKYQSIKGSDPFIDSELDNKWAETVKNILSRLTKGIDVAFITLGDPAIYSTFFYLYDRLLESNPELKIDIIPGVSSINASAAKAKISLGLADEKIAILPANYIENLNETLEKFDTVVLMKVNKVFEGIMHTLTEMNLLNNAIYISRACMEDEKVFKDIKDVKEEDLNYFSMVIVKKGR
ncbi:MAG: precorrin-2 C(20)-methyltransferase [Nitrospirae bacterium]|nr:precorrin-2 C(20)-methyltransferase [Nitrospirota bacterium]MBI3378660.1 precorrin-2 C(20)-methyltransferase [Nitrospirota bacterium]